RGTPLPEPAGRFPPSRATRVDDDGRVAVFPIVWRGAFVPGQARDVWPCAEAGHFAVVRLQNPGERLGGWAKHHVVHNDKVGPGARWQVRPPGVEPKKRVLALVEGRKLEPEARDLLAWLD